MKLAIAGPLADKNLGDYGMFINNLYDLGSEHEYTVFSYASEFVNSLKIDFLLDFDINFIDVVLKPKIEERASVITKLKKLKRSILKGEKRTYLTPFEVANRCANYEKIQLAIAECDVLVVSGGGYFNDLWYEWERSDDLLKIIVPIIFASFMKKKIVFTANGYGPFDSSKQFYSMIFAEAKDAYIGCRDNKLSPLYLADLNVNNVYFLPDDLYITNPKLMNSRVSKAYGKYIVLELYGNMTDLSENIDKLNEIVDFFNEKNIKTIFMPFDIDSKTKEFLIKKIRSKNFEIYSYESYLKLDDAISMIKNAELVICNRYHALVLSVANKTPVINILKSVGDYRYYYNKNAGFLDNTFGSENIDYNYFISESLSDVLTIVKEQLETRLDKQKNLFNSEFYKENRERLSVMRNDYFNNIILKSDKNYD